MAGQLNLAELTVIGKSFNYTNRIIFIEQYASSMLARALASGARYRTLIQTEQSKYLKVGSAFAKLESGRNAYLTHIALENVAGPHDRGPPLIFMRG